MEEHHEASDPDFDYRVLLENAPDALVLVGPGGEIRFVNSQTLSLFGYADGELTGQPVELLVPERFRNNHRAHRSEYAKAPRVRPMGLHLPHLSGRRKDGSEFLAEINLSPLPGGMTVVAVRERDRERERERERERLALLERHREREHERAQSREREREREHERAMIRARAGRMKGMSIWTAVAIVVLAQVVFNVLLYLFFGHR